MAEDFGLYKTSEGAALRFYETAEPNNAASARHGRPIFDQCLMVEVITPGSRESCPVFELERVYAEEVGIPVPARSHKYEEYKQQIEAYRSGGGNSDLRGTPLRAWPRMTTALAATCEHAGVFTIDALAALPETRFQALGPGARELVEQAKAFLAAAAGNAPTEALAAENAQLRADIERLTKTVQELSAQITPTTAPVEPTAEPEATPVNPKAEPEATVEPPVKAKTKAGGGNALPII